jgi:hypothetical protein
MALLRHHLQRQGVELERAAVRLRDLVLIRVGGHVGLAAAVQDHRFLRAQPLGLGDRINRGVAAADHRHAPAHRHLVQRTGVDQLDEVQRLEHLGQVLARDAQPIGAAQPDAHEHGVELLLQLADGEVLADLDPAADLHAELPDQLHLGQAGLRAQLVIRDAVGVEPAGLRLLLEHGDRVPEAGQLGRTAESRGSAADDRDLAAGLRRGRVERVL